MRQLVLWKLVTLDGFCLGAKDERPFYEFFSGWKRNAYKNEQSKAVGTLLFGRNTFEGRPPCHAGYDLFRPGPLRPEVSTRRQAM